MDSDLTQTVHTGVLRRAADLLGGIDALRAYLDVSPVKLGIWMRGGAAPPDDVFLRVVDLLQEHDGRVLPDEKTASRHGDTDLASQA